MITIKSWGTDPSGKKGAHGTTVRGTDAAAPGRETSAQAGRGAGRKRDPLSEAPGKRQLGRGKGAEEGSLGRSGRCWGGEEDQEAERDRYRLDLGRLA